MVPHVVAVLLFLCIPLAYFSPMLEGKAIAQHDREQWLGTARELNAHREAHDGAQSLWTNTLFGGMPSVLVSLTYPWNVVSWLDGALTAIPRPVSYIMLTMLGFYVLLLVLGVDAWVAIAGAVGYGLSTYFLIIVGAGHNAKSHALCYMAPMVAGAILLYRGRGLSGAVLFGLSLALSLVTGHLQITYYTMLVVGAVALWGLAEGLRGRDLRGFLRGSLYLLAAGVVAVGANFNRLYSTWDYGRESIRGKSDLTREGASRDGGLDRDYATSWSYGLEESFNLLIPRFNGGASGVGLLGQKSESESVLRAMGVPADQQARILATLPVYWGSQPMTSGPVYLGASMLLLCALGMLLIRHRLKWWLFGVGVLALMLSWGKYFPWLTNAFFDWVPGYNKFRTVSMILVICELVVPLLGFWGLSCWLGEGARDRRGLSRRLVWALGGGVGLALLLIVFGGALFDFTSRYDEQLLRAGFPADFLTALRRDRLSLMRADGWRSVLLMLLTGGVLLCWLRWGGRLRAPWLGVMLLGVVLLDMWPVAKRYDGVNWVSGAEYARPFRASAADAAILRDTTHYRVMNTTVSTFNDASTSYFHNSVGGYHGAKLRRFQDFVDHYAGEQVFLDLLNVKYVIVREGQEGGVAARRNRGAYGNAWFVDGVLGVGSADEELSRVGAEDLRRVALVDTTRFPRGGARVGPRAAGDSIWLEGHGADWQRYRYRAGGDRYAVFSEIFYPRGWEVEVDGARVDLQRADYLLRGAALPGGEHTVSFRFRQGMFAVGKYVDLLFGLALVVGACVCVTRWVLLGRADWRRGAALGSADGAANG